MEKEEFAQQIPRKFDVAWYLRDCIREFGWSRETQIRMYHELRKGDRWTLINVPEWLIQVTQKQVAHPDQLSLFEE
jgi:hypothetical protein